MSQARSRIHLKRRIWRISESAPLGEFVDPDQATQPTDPSSSEPRTGWALSTLELLRGVDVNDDPDSVPADLFDELFKRP